MQEVSAKEQKLLPKKKFAFKSRKKGSQPQTTGAEGREGGGGGGREREEGGGGGGRERGEGGVGRGRERGEGERGVGSNIQLKNLVGFRDRKDEKLLMSVSCKMEQPGSLVPLSTEQREPGSKVSTFVLIVCVLVLQADEVKGHDVDLVGLVSCKVRLCGAPSTLHMNKMEGCT